MATLSQCLREADNYIHTVSPKENPLWIADDAGSYEIDLKQALRSIREVQRMNLSGAFPQLEFPEPRFSKITETIYFGYCTIKLPLATSVAASRPVTPVTWATVWKL